MFTYNTRKDVEWSLPKHAFCIPIESLYGATLAVVAAISVERGLIHYEIHPKALNRKSFSTFVSNVANVAESKNKVMFLDNLPVHKTVEVRVTFV